MGVRLAMALSVLLCACDHGAATTAASARPSSPAVEGSPAADGAAGTSTFTLTVAGTPRIVVVHVPPATAPSPRPLVLNLHGSGGTAEGQEAYSGMDAIADDRGFVVAYPQGAIPIGSGYAWNVPGQPLVNGQSVPPDAADDVAFCAQTIAWLERAFAVDPKRVFATGMSGGGRMASQLGCDLAATLAAVAPVAGLRFPTPCSGQRPTPVVAFHGTADTVNPFDGGGPAYWTESVPSALQEWAAHDTCAPTPAEAHAAPGVRLTAYPGCASGAEVQLYAIDGAGHEWPGAPGQTVAIDANATMWSFFAAHGR